MNQKDVEEIAKMIEGERVDIEANIKKGIELNDEDIESLLDHNKSLDCLSKKFVKYLDKLYKDKKLRVQDYSRKQVLRNCGVE